MLLKTVGRNLLYLSSLSLWLRALRTAALCTAALCAACSSKTPVPFKRPESETATHASTAQQAQEPATVVAVHAAEVVPYTEGTHRIVVADTTIERGLGEIYASSERDLDADGRPDVVTITSDEHSQVFVEVTAHAASSPSARVALNSEPIARGCRALQARLFLLGKEQGLASVDFMCSAQAATAGLPTGTSDAIAPAQATDLPPPEPDATQTAHTQHFVFSLSMQPQVRLRVAAYFSEDEALFSPNLHIVGTDVDGDQLEDVQIELSPSSKSGLTQPVQLTWLMRTTGLARDRREPEAALSALIADAKRNLSKRPKDALSLADRTLALHRALCRESGGARLWIDEARGVSCEASNAAGTAVAVRAIAHARLQQLLPALEARAELDNRAYAVDKKQRDQVASAIGEIRGDTGYRWLVGPQLAATSAPNLHLPAIGFIDEQHLLVRGLIPQSYDLQTLVATPTGVPGSPLAEDAAHTFVLTDIVRACDGYRVRIAKAGSVIGRIVTSPNGSDLLLAPLENGDEHCVPGSRAQSDPGGFTLLGLNQAGAVFARGTHLWLLPLDANVTHLAGNAATTSARELSARATLAPLNSPGALDASGRYLALATSEGVAVVDRAQDNARLVRSPASCQGNPISDAVLSPSGQKLAMLCAGHIYIAEPAPAAESGGPSRPLSETP